MDYYKYFHIMQSVTGSPWAILPQKLAVIKELLAIRASGGHLDAEDIKAAMDTRAATPGQPLAGSSVALLPLVGTVIPRLNLLTESSGAISVQRFTGLFRAAMADPDVQSIIIDVDSPGGQVGGVEELSQEIYDARGVKPVTAVVNTLAASAAYWIASAAGEVVITPSGQAGSIGVLAIHQDISSYLEKEGVAVNLVAAGKYKIEGNPYEPLTDEAREAIQVMVDQYYELFITAVARNRGASPAAVRDGYGQGRVVGAADAVTTGLADRTATLSQVIEEQAGRSRSRSRSRRANARHRLQIERMK